MNSLFLIGTAVFIGVCVAKPFQKLKIPQVVGYIVIGVILSRSALGMLQPEYLASLTPLINLTLGIIGFLIGAELIRTPVKWLAYWNTFRWSKKLTKSY